MPAWLIAWKAQEIGGSSKVFWLKLEKLSLHKLSRAAPMHIAALPVRGIAIAVCFGAELRSDGAENVFGVISLDSAGFSMQPR